MDTTQEIENKIEKAIEQLAQESDILELVKSIEGKIETTKGHYGDYMNFLTPFVKNGKLMFRIIVEALIKAGANSYGVQMAANILTGQ